MHVKYDPAVQCILKCLRTSGTMRTNGMCLCTHQQPIKDEHLFFGGICLQLLIGRLNIRSEREWENGRFPQFFVCVLLFTSEFVARQFHQRKQAITKTRGNFWSGPCVYMVRRMVEWERRIAPMTSKASSATMANLQWAYAHENTLTPLALFRFVLLFGSVDIERGSGSSASAPSPRWQATDLPSSGTTLYGFVMHSICSSESESAAADRFACAAFR